MNLVLTIACIFCFLLFINYFIPHLVKIYWRQKFLKTAELSKRIFLTFDDGPVYNSTSEILDLLKKYYIKATFFVVGKNVKINIDLIERIIREGHAIGIHGNNHLHPWKVNPWRAMKDLSEGSRILKDIGINTKLIRPPYGKLNLLSLLFIIYNKLIFVHWNVDPRDYERSEKLKLYNLLNEKITSGKVVLLHDGRLNSIPSTGVTTKGLELFLEKMEFNPHLFSEITSII